MVASTRAQSLHISANGLRKEDYGGVSTVSGVGGFLASVGNRGIKPTISHRYLTPGKAAKLVDAVGCTAFPERNRLLVLMMYRHGLRVSEATGLRWLDIDLKRRTLDTIG